MLRFFRNHIHPAGDFKNADIHDFFEYTPVSDAFSFSVSCLVQNYL